MTDPLKDLVRLGDDALGPCACCGKLMLALPSPVFYRVTVEYCGVDAKAVQQRVGLAQFFGGGAEGLALSGIMGSHQKPVLVMAKGTVNVCLNCSMDATIAQIHAPALESQAEGEAA